MASEERRGRAAPRKAKKDPDEAPLFLQKTFQMVDTVTTIFFYKLTCFSFFLLVFSPPNILFLGPKMETHLWLKI